MAAPKTISLLPQEGFEYTTLGKSVHWALTAGRIIVIITELIVVSAFLSRFWLDRTLTNLNEKINQKTAIIRASQPFEQEFRTTQTKLARFAQITKESNFGNLTNQIFASLPAEVVLSQITIDGEVANVSGIALSEGGLGEFSRNLEAQKIGNVSLGNVSLGKREESAIQGIRFTIKITLPARKGTNEGK